MDFCLKLFRVGRDDGQVLAWVVFLDKLVGYLEALKFPVKLFEKKTYSEYNEAIKHEWRLL